MISRILDRMATVAEYISVGLLAVLAFQMGLGAILRYGFEISYRWLEDFNTYYFTYLVFLMTAVLVRRWGHIRIEVLPIYLEGHFRRLIRPLQIVTVLIILGYAVATTHLAWGSFYISVTKWTLFPTEFMGIFVPQLVVYLAYLLGMFLLTVFALDLVVTTLRRPR